mmetsp:Transcript_54688/g.163435  ORF Transcript_54688/g.163435 Transcript_54688/m.163435 type:complete len:167 (+) Transcript_54688:195-695(+)
MAVSPKGSVLIPPKGIGPVEEPNPNDVLSGRGGRINSHTGNLQFREIVQRTKSRYLSKSTKKLEKAHIAFEIVVEIRGMDPNGRFLKEDPETGLWWDIGDEKAKKEGRAGAAGGRSRLSYGVGRGRRCVRRGCRQSPEHWSCRSSFVEAFEESRLGKTGGPSKDIP